MPSPQQIRQIRIEVDAPGVKAALDSISASMGSLNKNTKSIADSFNLVKLATEAWAGYQSIKWITDISDSMQNLGNRLKIVGAAGEDTHVTMQKLFDLANDTKQSISDVGQTYTRLGASLKSAGANSDELIALTRVLTNSFKVSGSTATEAASGVIELTQSFSRGTLEGRQLRAITLENNVLAQALREKFGNDLVGAGEKGLITVSGVLEVLSKHLTDINQKATLLKPTFEQTLTKAYNTFALAVGGANEQLGLSEKFAKGVDILIDSVKTLALVGGDLARDFLQSDAFEPMAYTALALAAALFPIPALLIAVGYAVSQEVGSMGELIDKIRNLGAWFAFLGARISETETKFLSFSNGALKLLGLGSSTAADRISELTVDMNALDLMAESLGTKKYTPSPLLDPKATKSQVDLIEELRKKYDAINKTAEKQVKIKDVLAALNKEFITGAINASEYNTKLEEFDFYKLNREFAEGKINLDQLNEAMDKVREKNIGKELQSGAISISEFNTQIKELKIQELTDKFAEGKLTVLKYNEEIIKLQDNFNAGGALLTGTSSFIDSIGTVSSNVADSIKDAFSNLETSLENFIKTGKFNFSKFTQGILDDLTKIIIRAAIIRPLANGILDFAGSLGGATAGGGYGSAGESGIDVSGISAKGNIFDHGLQKFASGGVVNGATAFSFGSGRTGVMGEAGPEAILPLQRGSGGKLGVAAQVTPVLINIINQTGSDVHQSETTGPNGEKQIEILISSKMKEAFAGGKMDTVMKNSFGLNRRGS